MSAKNLLHFGRIDVQSAADDHVALPVGEMEIAVRVATGHVADRAILAPERSSCLLRRFPVTLKRVRRTGIEFANFAVGDFGAVWIQKFDSASAKTFAADRAELGQLLFGAQHSHPPGFSRAIG